MESKISKIGGNVTEALKWYAGVAKIALVSVGVLLAVSAFIVACAYFGALPPTTILVSAVFVGLLLEFDK